MHRGLHNRLGQRLGASRFAHKKQRYPQLNADCYHEDILSEGSISGNVWTQDHAVQKYFLAAEGDENISIFNYVRQDVLHALN